MKVTLGILLIVMLKADFSEVGPGGQPQGQLLGRSPTVDGGPEPGPPLGQSWELLGVVRVVPPIMIVYIVKPLMIVCAVSGYDKLEK
ncbi:pseudouridine synthase [Aphanothece sacrum FPU3]|nr:pseudouridine synthase [Aphanothece sacrum FPU3]